MTRHEQLLREAALCVEAAYEGQTAVEKQQDDPNVILAALEQAIDTHRYQRWSATQGIYSYRKKPAKARLPRIE